MLNRLGQRVLQVFALQPGQGIRTLLTATYLFLVIAVYMMIKPASKSLFLEKLSALELPWVTVVVALTLGLFVAFYIRLSKRMGAPMLTIGTLIAGAATVVGFWALLDGEVVWAYPVFAVWVGMYGAIAATQVWTLANELFTTREAKRAFGIVGAGGIIGGIAGYSATRALAEAIGTVALLLVAAGLLLIAAGIVAVLVRYRLPGPVRMREKKVPQRLQDSLRVVARSPHLRLVAGLVLVTALATKMVDWQFDAMVEVFFPDKDERTAFYGTFGALTGIVGIAIQVLLTSRLLMVLGLGGTILIFPLAMTGGTLALIGTLSLWSGVLARGSDNTLKHSIDRSSRELVYLPVSRTVKVQAKSAIDMVVDRAGDGMAGFAQLAVIVISGSVGLSQLEMVRNVGLVNLAFLAAWLFLAVKLRRSYVDELHRSIAEGRIEVSGWQTVLAGADTLGAVRRALESDNDEEVQTALELVAANPQWELTEDLARLARRGSPELRARALAILLSPEDSELPAGVEAAFESEDQLLFADLVDVLLAENAAERRKRADAVLERGGGPARGAWIALMVRRMGPEFQPVATKLLTELVDPASPPAARAVAATSIGMLPPSFPTADLLHPLLEDADPHVAAAAARAAVTVGDDTLLRAVVPLLGRPGTRRAARRAFRSVGERAIPLLLAAAHDESVPRRARLRIPSVLSALQTPETLSALTELLGSSEPDIVGEAADALYRIRLTDPELQLIPSQQAHELVRAEAQRHDAIVARLASLGGTDLPGDAGAAALLVASLEHEERRSHANVFRLLCLAYPPRDILGCRRSLVEHDMELRANAAELLDNLVPRRLWRELLPILYREEFGKRDDLFVHSAGEPRDVLNQLATGSDPWVSACAVQLIGSAGLESGREAVRQAARHPDGRLKEAAGWALMQLEGRGTKVKSMTVVEKVIALRNIDVFRDTPPEQLSRVAAVAREELFPANEVLYREGDPPGDLFVVLGGRVAVERDGKRLGELSEGEALGTWALFEDDTRRLTARTVDETPTLRIDRWGFEEVLDEHPDVARSLISNMVRRVRALAEG